MLTRQQINRDCTMKRKTSKVQTLYDACNAVFCQKDQILPSFQQIQWLKSLLDKMEAIDVGIDEFGSGGSSPSSSPDCPKELVCGKDVSKITYIHLHECDHFSMGVFCFPAGGTFPLHDHPEMTVLSKLLYGSVHVKAYDWVSFDDSTSRTIGLAGTVMNGVLKSPCETSILFPRSGGNIHSFTAITPCAILDVLTPPYSEESERHCTYFLDYNIPSLSGYVVLEERDLPDDLEVEGAPYVGPRIIAVDDDDDDNSC